MFTNASATREWLQQTCKPNGSMTSEWAVSFWRTVAWHVNTHLKFRNRSETIFVIASRQLWNKVQGYQSFEIVAFKQAFYKLQKIWNLKCFYEKKFFQNKRCRETLKNRELLQYYGSNLALECFNNFRFLRHFSQIRHYWWENTFPPELSVIVK